MWEQAMAPVRTLMADGWALRRVLIDWGPSEPLTPGEREKAARRVTDCHGDCDLHMIAGSPGRGRTVFELER